MFQFRSRATYQTRFVPLNAPIDVVLFYETHENGKHDHQREVTMSHDNTCIQSPERRLHHTGSASYPTAHKPSTYFDAGKGKK